MSIFYVDNDTVKEVENFTNEHRFTGMIKVNGYEFGDRMLEDVYFLADVENGILKEDSVRIDPKDANYFEQFNKKHWLNAALNSIKSGDIYETNTDNEVVRDWWNDEDQSKPQKMDMGPLF